MVPDPSIQRLAAFSNGDTGGNPAGVVLVERLPDDASMQRIAAAVGYSETAFATPEGAGFRVRYFSPEAEVPFCGHATIALGAALAMRHGNATYALALNDAAITVDGRHDASGLRATLLSPPTRSATADAVRLDEALDLFGLARDDLDDRVPPATVHAGADHFVLMLRDRATLTAMRYDFDRGRRLMRREGWLTVLLGHAASAQRFATRNAFAYGGVYEDPATGAATAALAGYLRDLGWPHGGTIEVHQGDDMGVPSRLHADIASQPGSPIRVGGTVRPLDH